MIVDMKLIPHFLSHRKLQSCSLSLCKKSFQINITPRKLLSTSVSSRQSREVVFLGSDNFAIPSLVSLLKCFGSDSVIVVVSNQKNTVGNFAKRRALKTVVWDDFKKEESSPETESCSKNENLKKYYLGVVASFGYLIPENVIKRFQKGIFNVHPSLLPKYRGAAPINHSIINGDSVTGVSIMKIAAHKFDVGPLYKVITVPMHPHIRAPELSTILARIGADTLSEVLENLDYHSQNPILQDDREASLARKLTPSMANVDWRIHTSKEIYNLFRGLSGFFNLKTTYDGKEISLHELGILKIGPDSDNVIPEIVSDSGMVDINTDFSKYYASPISWTVKSLPENVLPGHVIFKNFVLCIKCKENSANCSNQDDSGWIFARKVKVGTKWMTANDFENGFLRKGRKRGVIRFEALSDSTIGEKCETGKRDK